MVIYMHVLSYIPSICMSIVILQWQTLESGPYINGYSRVPAHCLRISASNGNMWYRALNYHYQHMLSYREVTVNCIFNTKIPA